MINVDRYFVTLRNIIGQVDTPRVNGNRRWGAEEAEGAGEMGEMGS
ncbi:MAG: hypothetical protein F6K21_21290 [Symploca sp. SIO2D2]|nr:hypothetical protein [Symploca sp. SIO2D2]